MNKAKKLSGIISFWLGGAIIVFLIGFSFYIRFTNPDMTEMRIMIEYYHILLPLIFIGMPLFGYGLSRKT